MSPAPVASMSPGIRCYSAVAILDYGTAVIRRGRQYDRLRGVFGETARFNIRLILQATDLWSASWGEDQGIHRASRMMREKQVLGTLHKGRNTIGDITEMIYVEVSPALKRSRSFPFKRTWRKLIREGRVKSEGGRYPQYRETTESVAWQSRGDYGGLGLRVQTFPNFVRKLHGSERRRPVKQRWADDSRLCLTFKAVPRAVQHTFRRSKIGDIRLSPVQPAGSPDKRGKDDI